MAPMLTDPRTLKIVRRPLNIRPGQLCEALEIAGASLHQLIGPANPLPVGEEHASEKHQNRRRQQPDGVDIHRQGLDGYSLSATTVSRGVSEGLSALVAATGWAADPCRQR